MEETAEQKKQEPKAPKPATLAVGIQFRAVGKIYTFATTDPSMKIGEVVVVETEKGTALGSVIEAPKETPAGSLPKNVKRVLHRASAEELEGELDRREKALDYFAVCREKIAERALLMKLIDTEIVDGGKKVVFTFFAEQRIDFRSLVKDLAGALRMRIEMRQVGSRDEAKYVGCIGPCGLETCCSRHLRQFQSISISMAKHQGLTPNPAKLTGMCGKLKCCLAYEHAVYREYQKTLPKVGSAVTSPGGAGKIIGHNVLKRECIVRLYGGAGECRCACDACTPMSEEQREEAIKAARKSKEEADERPRRRGGREGKRPEKRNKRHGKKR